jgi:multidrug efflux pump subunit AcrA (membrane-fusion protein)
VLGARTELSGAVIAAGSLVVESNVKKVAHPVGGSVGELLVHEGAKVSEGDILVHLDETVAKSNLATIVQNLWELSARGARLEAERDGAPELAFPDALVAAAHDPDVDHVVTGERKLFALRREALLGQKKQLHERVAQLGEEIKGLTEQTEAKGEEIRLVQEELAGVQDLWDKKLIPITRLTVLERDAARLKGERGQLVASTAQARGKIIGPGEQIMLIVPQADTLVVDVRIPAQDIDQVQVGQSATLRFPNFNARTTPELDGTVIRIAADVSKDDKTGASYYLARIRMIGERVDPDMRFIPGMPVDVFVHTAQRTLLSYLVKPLMDQASRAFREK